MAKGTQVKILEAAEDLFWHNGYKATSIDQIAQKAGQSKGAVFHYFRNKNDVSVLALKKYASEELFSPMEAAFSGARTIKDALLIWVQGIYEAYGQKGYNGGCLLGNMALELSDQDEELRAELSKVFLELENTLVSLLKEHEGGEAAKSEILMEPRQFARVLIATLQGILMTIKVHKDKNRAAREFQALAEMIERLIRG